MVDDKNAIVYELLMKVFRDNAYASIALSDALEGCREEDKPYITKLFYGVLERSVYYDYVLESFADSKPKKPIAVITKMGYYLLENMRVPEYAAVDNMVKLCKKAGKSGASGFVNSALRKFAPPPLPEVKDAKRLSVEFAYPLWLTEMLVNDYGYDFTRDMLASRPNKRTHIRVNYPTMNEKKFAEKYGRYLSGDEPELERGKVGYYATRKFLSEANRNDYVIQSAASIAAVHSYLYGIDSPKTVLDLCAAPGGKAVLLSALTDAQVTACDVHKHRVELIRKYAFKCDCRVLPVLNDATVPRPDWRDKFALVVCDVPCSGIGVAGSKPDILYNRSPEDINKLNDLQKEILSVAAEYVAPGGRLCYSTCTVLKKENEDTVASFLKEHGDFETVKIKSPYCELESDAVRLFPHRDGTDGFYVAAMKKK